MFSLGFTHFHLVSHIFTWFHIFSHGFTHFHTFSHGFTHFHLISHIFTLVSHVFTCFHTFSRCEKVWKSVRWITSLVLFYLFSLCQVLVSDSENQYFKLPHPHHPPPPTNRTIEYDKGYLRENFENFYEDTFEELMKVCSHFKAFPPTIHPIIQLGEIKELNVVDNLCEHLIGNVYVKFATEDDAENALKNLLGRFYEGRPLQPEYVPVTDFRESSCRQYEEELCERGSLCNFMHLKAVSRSLLRELFSEQKKLYKERRRERKRRDRSPDERRIKDKSDRDPRDRQGDAEPADAEVHGLGRATTTVRRTRETSEERRERLRSHFETKHGEQKWDD